MYLLLFTRLPVIRWAKNSSSSFFYAEEVLVGDGDDDVLRSIDAMRLNANSHSERRKGAVRQNAKEVVVSGFLTVQKRQRRRRRQPAFCTNNRRTQHSHTHTHTPSVQNAKQATTADFRWSVKCVHLRLRIRMTVEKKSV